MTGSAVLEVPSGWWAASTRASAEPWEEEVVLRNDAAGDGELSELKIRIRELPMADGVHASTGCQLWSASIVLACELLRRPHLVAGKQVIEVGAGCGLSGIAAARLARRTLITDGDEEVVSNLSHNLRANEPMWRSSPSEAPREAFTRTLRWEDVLDVEWPAEERAEAIIASDIIYGHWGETVARALLKMLAPGGLILLAASEDRRSGIRGFKDYLSAAGFRILETKLRVPLGQFRTYECRERQPGETDDPPVVVETREHLAPAKEAAADSRQEPTQPRPAPTRHPQPRETGSVVDRASFDRRPVPAVADSPASCPANDKHEAPERGVWRVVGGRSQGGIIVRHGSEAAKSDYSGRLKHGALIAELERTAQRLRYAKLSGEGPEGGWVSFFSAKGAALLLRLEEPPELA